MTSANYHKLNSFGEIHPGQVLREYLDSNCWSQTDLALRTGIAPKTISEICNGKAPITPRTSLTFEKAFRRPAHFWLNLQRIYDEEIARNKYEDSLKNWIPWSQKFPIDELRALNLIHASEGEANVLQALLSFSGVSSPDCWHRIWEASKVSFRQTRTQNTSIESVFAWIRATEHYSEQIRTSEYDEHGVLDAIELLRKCTLKRADKGIQFAQSICASVGIALVLVPMFPHTEISGCARWLSSNRALVALSNRFGTDDHLWFTFFHELAHILLHKKTHKFLLDNAVDNLLDKVVDPQIQKQEDEANRFAFDALIPPDYLAEFIHRAEFTNQSIENFSEYVGVGPGIIVGRLQYEELLEPFQGNELKQKINIEATQ